MFTKKYFRVYLKGFTAKFCSLKIWISNSDRN
ncbi:hypothetical protein LTSEBAI_5295, partial [Salmonella enterica subsp. enterica serovar Baildon str. R6-199]